MAFSVCLAGLMYCLLAGALSTVPLLALCFGVVVLFRVLHHILPHNHDNWTSIDYHAQQSRLCSLPAGFKVVWVVATIVLVVASQSMVLSLSVLILACIITVFGGKTKFSTLFTLLLTPSTFLVLSGLTLVFVYDTTANGVVNLPWFQGYLTITNATQVRAATVVLGALSSVSCLYALCLSTPLYQLIGTFRKAGFPEIIIELMYLIYRYIFVLSGSLTQMRTAAACRLGFSTYGASFTSTARIMAGLLAVSMKKASLAFDAMESRCYVGKLAFLERPTKAPKLPMVLGAVLFCGLVFLKGVI